MLSLQETQALRRAFDVSQRQNFAMRKMLSEIVRKQEGKHFEPIAAVELAMAADAEPLLGGKAKTSSALLAGKSKTARSRPSTATTTATTAALTTTATTAAAAAATPAAHATGTQPLSQPLQWQQQQQQQQQAQPIVPVVRHEEATIGPESVALSSASSSTASSTLLRGQQQQQQQQSVLQSLPPALPIATSLQPPPRLAPGVRLPPPPSLPVPMPSSSSVLYGGKSSTARNLIKTGLMRPMGSGAGNLGASTTGAGAIGGMGATAGETNNARSESTGGNNSGGINIPLNDAMVMISDIVPLGRSTTQIRTRPSSAMTPTLSTSSTSPFPKIAPNQATFGSASSHPLSLPSSTTSTSSASSFGGGYYSLRQQQQRPVTASSASSNSGSGSGMYPY